MKIAIIGCGLIGKKRALSITGSDQIIACCDTNQELAKAFAGQFQCTAFTDHKKLLSETKCEAVVIAVVNKFALQIIMDAIQLGIHVIAEKPLGRNVDESKRIITQLETSRTQLGKHIVVKTGFNHRFHPAIWKAKNLFDEKKIGELMFIRARYGHGGRAGMEKEWRASKELCGGGELLDQGVHIIDLCNWFAGDIAKVMGSAKTKFWDMEVEDNAFVYMISKQGADIQFNVSWTNWKNIFSFEIFGTKGYLSVQGLGGSYGPETLEVGIRKPEGGRPDIENFEFDPKDISWEKEWQEFQTAIQNKKEPIGNGLDGHKANQIINAIYQSSQKEAFIHL